MDAVGSFVKWSNNLPHTLSNLPQIQALMLLPKIASIVDAYSRTETVVALRNLIGEIRAMYLKNGSLELPDFSGDAFATSIVTAIESARAMSLQQVINATGIIIHTNLGRARLAPLAVEAMQGAASAPTNLELNLTTGKRGSRHDHLEARICALTGAEAAVVVNNCAAAVLLSLMATAHGRAVVASRGELIEIGGAFRLPDVIAQSGAVLREVGTTNRTRLADYEAAIDENTAVLLKSHTSNFRIVGFTSAPTRRDLAQLAADRNVILMEDLGSGVICDLSPYGLTDEPVVADILKSGTDLVMFSGDKLLGGPQAGIIAGKRDIIARLKAHPLMRALRIDKLSLAALEATLRLYSAPYDPFKEIPVLAMLSEPVEDVRRRAEGMAAQLSAIDTVVQESVAQVGAGSVPEQGIPSFAVSCSIGSLSPDGLMFRLRQNKTPVIGRIERDRVLLDMRTVMDREVPVIIAALRAAAQE
jgi:L-seryl-tRNA(Ser) seleniumtransferase